MTENFNNYVKKLLKEMDIVGVLGNAGSYDVSDPRNPVILGPTQRRLKFKRKHKKAH